MKITLLVNHDLASCVAVNLLKPLFRLHDVRLYVSSKVGGVVEPSESLGQLRFFEQTLFNEVLTPLMLESNHQAVSPQRFLPLECLTERPLITLNHINSPEGMALLNEDPPDLMVSIRFGRILKSPVLNIPRLGVLNLHSGLLPQYRGVMASFWAMLKGETELGTTLHYISDGTIDTGNVIAQSTLPVDPTRSYLWHVLQLYFGGSELILDAVGKLSAEEKLVSMPQTGHGGYFSFPDEKALQEFHQKGLTLVSENDVVEFLQAHFLSLNK